MACVFEALGQSHTYDPRRNRTLVFGALAGSLAGLGSVAFTLWFAEVELGRSPRSLSYALLALLFLAHPIVFGFLSGTLETVWEELASQALPCGELLPFPGTPEAIADFDAPATRMNRVLGALLSAAASEGKGSLLVVDVQRIADRSSPIPAGSEAPIRAVPEALPASGGHEKLLLLVPGSQLCAPCLRDRFSRSLATEERMRVRAGLAAWPADGATPEALLRAAQLNQAGELDPPHSAGCRSAPSRPRHGIHSP